MNFKVIKFPGEDTTYIMPTWDEMNQLTFAISKKMIQAKLKFDRIVTLAKGGWPMTRSMVDFLSVDKVASIGVKFYNGIYKKLKQPQVYPLYKPQNISAFLTVGAYSTHFWRPPNTPPILHTDFLGHLYDNSY